MATRLDSAKDAVRYVRKLLVKHPDGLLVVGPAAAGKTVLIEACKAAGLRAYDGDKWGAQKGDAWHIKWADIPDDFDVVAGVTDNIADFDRAWDTTSMGCIILEPPVQRWQEAMRARSLREKHKWVPEFKRIAELSRTKAAEELKALLSKVSSQVGFFGSRRYRVVTLAWKGVADETGRATRTDEPSKEKADKTTVTPSANQTN